MTDTAHELRRQRLTGIGLMCGADAAFACLDCMAKYLGTHMPVSQVVGVRYASAFLIALMFSNPLNRPGLLRTGRSGVTWVGAAAVSRPAGEERHEGR